MNFLKILYHRLNQPVNNRLITVFNIIAEENNSISIIKKAQAMLATIGVQPSEVSSLLELSKDSLSQTDPVVNVLFRIKQNRGYSCPYFCTILCESQNLLDRCSLTKYNQFNDKGGGERTMPTLEEKEIAFVNLLACLIPAKTAAAVAACLNTEEEMMEMFYFLKKKNYIATKQEILNECGRIIEKYEINQKK